MSKNNNHDIESIFQKAAEAYPAGFEEKHWQDLKTMLDEQKNHAVRERNNKIRRSLLALAALLLFSTGAFWFTSEYNSDTNKDRLEASEPKFSVEGKKKIELNKEVRKEDYTEVKNEKEGKNEKYVSDVAKAISTETDTEIDFLEIAGVETDATATNSLDVKEASRSSLNNLKPVQSKENKAAGNEKKINDLSSLVSEYKQPVIDFNDKPAAQNFPSDTDSPAEVDSQSLKASFEELELNDLQSNAAGKRIEEGNNELLRGSDSDTLNVKLETETDTLLSESEVKPIVEGEDNLRRSPLLSVTFTVGPDLSVIGLDNITSPGYSYGLMIHYNISKKWSLGIGALKTTKKYVGHGNDYQPPKGYWEYATNNVIPIKVTGECALIEIPIDLRYDILSSSKNHFYVSGGVSSYFMQRESYQYSFEEYNPYASQGWSSEKGEDSHLFNILNFSIGYERAIGKKFRIGASPYVKAPVKGIGWSEVKFISFGTYFNLKYNLLTRNK